MKQIIKSRFNGHTLYECEAESMLLALQEAVCSGAYLSGANLSGANLSGVNLSRVNLSRANLSGADLSGVNLSRVNLSGANLSGANLSGVNLSGAYLSGADLSGVNLSGADLSRVNLSGANLSGVNLSRAEHAELAIAITRILPAGTLVAWKKCKADVIVKLEIPSEARRSSAFGRKCRCEYADVLEVIGAEVGISQHDGKTKYRAGHRVTCDEWCKDFTKECAGGIHFYITEEEARAS